MTKSSQTFTLSIEPTGERAFQHCYHLGTIERTARECAEYIFKSRNSSAYEIDIDGHRMATCTVALIRNGKVFAVFDGKWDRE